MEQGQDEAATIWTIHQDVAVVEHRDTFVVLLMSSTDPVPLALEGTASTVWRAIDGVRAGSEIVAEVAASYDQDVGLVRSGVLGFLHDLAGAGLLVSNPTVT